MFAHMTAWLARMRALLISLPLCAGVAAWGIADPAGPAGWAGRVTGAVFGALDWVYMLWVTGLLVLGALIYLGWAGSLLVRRQRPPV
jgi:choline-glycine betaine transporter